MTFKATRFSTLTFTVPDMCCHIICADLQSPIHITFSDLHHRATVLWLQNKLPRITRDKTMTNHPFNQVLRDYFSGQTLNILPEPPASPFINNGTKFQQKVWRLINKIPYGQTRTYGELAKELGNKNYARAVGQACNSNPLAIVTPCHRVISATGLGGFAGGTEVKKYLLQLEKRNLQESHNITGDIL